MTRPVRISDLLAASLLLAFFCFAFYKTCLWHDYLVRQVMGG